METKHRNEKEKRKEGEKERRGTGGETRRKKQRGARRLRARKTESTYRCVRAVNEQWGQEDAPIGHSYCLAL